ncbi:hypothetical protein V5O48_012323 [Marasmius crinis-equi]|uniref:Uncharacterized protein n=1 Tax=Marasmius crinis-equi TaxID=585013 RepID=A0ABR3F362_9AGAR
MPALAYGKLQVAKVANYNDARLQSGPRRHSHRKHLSVYQLHDGWRSEGCLLTPSERLNLFVSAQEQRTSRQHTTTLPPSEYVLISHHACVPKISISPPDSHCQEERDARCEGTLVPAEDDPAPEIVVSPPQSSSASSTSLQLYSSRRRTGGTLTIDMLRAKTLVDALPALEDASTSEDSHSEAHSESTNESVDSLEFVDGFMVRAIEVSDEVTKNALLDVIENDMEDKTDRRVVPDEVQALLGMPAPIHSALRESW